MAPNLNTQGRPLAQRQHVASNGLNMPVISAAKDPVKAAYRLVQQVWDQPVTVTACDRDGSPVPFSFRYLDYMANGTFGVVCRARDLNSNEIVAIKTVYQDEAHQNRELSIGRSLRHDNIVATKYYFYTRNENGEEFLSLVMEWMPTSMDKLLREAERKATTSDTLGGVSAAAAAATATSSGGGGGGRVPIAMVQHAMRHFAQSLEYLHGQGICHRDIKPHNLLLDPATGLVKLCDFGCSKRLQPGEPNIQYICARYYRAPEILLGWARYSSAIDLWSAGCVLAELLTGIPIFPGKNSIDQLARIVKLLGTPTPQEMVSMGQTAKQLSSRPPLTPAERRGVLRAVVTRYNEALALPCNEELVGDAVDLLARLLEFDPSRRISPADMLQHPFLSNLVPLSSS